MMQASTTREWKLPTHLHSPPCRNRAAGLALAFLLVIPLHACNDGSGTTDSTGIDTGFTDDNGDNGDDKVTTDHCGGISGSETWAVVDSPHLLTCDVLLTGSLVLEPGIELYMEPGTHLQVDGGTLQALGTNAAPILVESNSASPTDGDFGTLSSNNGTISLANVTIRHGGAEGAILELTGGTASLEQLHLSNGTEIGLQTTGTEFSLLDGVNVAYVDIPLEISFNAAQELRNPDFSEVQYEEIRISESTLSTEITLSQQPYPFTLDSLSVSGEGSLKLAEGARLRISEDLVVQDGAIVIWGGDDNPAQLLAADGTEPVLEIQAEASAATFRYADFQGVGIECASDLLFFIDSSISDTPGTALNLTGAVKYGNPEFLTGNVFSAQGPGLVVGIEDLPAVGDNDYSATSFDGVVCAGGTLSTDMELSELPSEQVLVEGDITVDGATLTMGGGTLRFSWGTSLVVRDGAMLASGVSFLQQDDIPGTWYGITLGTGAAGSVLDGCEVAHAGMTDGSAEGADITLGSSAVVMNSVIRDSGAWGVVVLEGADPVLLNNSFSGNSLGDEYRY